MFTPLKKTVTALAVAALLGAAWTVTGVQGGFTAKITNSKNSIGSGIVFVAAAGDGSTQCDTTPAGSTIPSTSAFDCSNTTRSLPPQTPGGSVVNTTASMDRTLSATGTISPGSATYRRNSCGVVQLANTIDATNPLLVRGTVQFARAANWSDAGSLLVDGTSALGSSVTTTAGSTSTSSTVGIWFKAAPGSAGGALIAMDPSAAQVTSSNSVTTRLLYLDATGNVVAGAHSGTITVSNRFKVTTTGTDYRDNSWHFAALTIAPSGNKTALKLYVDGSLKKSSTSTGAPIAVSANYWHIGWADISGTSNWSGTNALTNHFPGSLSNAFIDDAAQDSRIATLNNSTSQAEWDSNLSRLGVTAAWPLGDDGNQTYSGTFPGGAANPCTAINVIVDDTANPSCVYPSTPTAACPALGNTRTMQTLATAGTLALKASTLSQAQTLTTTVARNTNYNTSFAVGLHLLYPLTITETVGGFGYTLNWTGNRYVI